MSVGRLLGYIMVVMTEMTLGEQEALMEKICCTGRRCRRQRTSEGHTVLVHLIDLYLLSKLDCRFVTINADFVLYEAIRVGRLSFYSPRSISSKVEDGCTPRAKNINVYNHLATERTTAPVVA